MYLRLLHFSISAVLIALIISSCSEEQTEPSIQPKKSIVLTEEDLVFEYEYEEDLQIYLTDNFDQNIEINSDDTLLFIPLNSCAACVKYTLLAANCNPFNGKVIIGGVPEDFESFKGEIDILTNRIEHVFFDSSFAMNEYLIEVGGPTMLLKKSEKWRIIELSIAHWPLIIDILGWEAPAYDFTAEH